MRVYSNDCSFAKSPKGRLFVELWNKSVKEFTREFSYMAECASLSFTTSLGPDHVEFRWSGYSDSLPQFISQSVEILLKMRSADN